MKYYIIAGEASGDLHGSNLMKSLKMLDTDADFRFWGGELMQNVGGKIVKHYKDTAFMGIFEVVTHLRTIKKNFDFCEKDLIAYEPDVLILIDYPGFNLRVAKFARKHGIKVYYYISPKLWAWNTGRVKRVKANVNRMFTILPFETGFYKKYGVKVDYSGNPVLDAIEKRLDKNETFNDFISHNGLEDRPIVGILAGSRTQEVERILPDMLKMVDEFPDYQFVIAAAPCFDQAYYNKIIGNRNVKVVFNQTYEILKHAKAAMVTSGTATLEAALIRTPQVVCYKMWGGRFTDFMAKKVLIKVPYISLINLILNREAVKELFQSTFSLAALKSELDRLLHDPVRIKEVEKDYEELSDLMGGPGSSQRTAEKMIHYLTRKKLLKGVDHLD